MEDTNITFLLLQNNAPQESIGSAQQYIAYENMKKELSALNVNRGGKNSYGFVFEHLHAAEDTNRKLASGVQEYVEVVDNNGPVDLYVRDWKGNKLHEQQVKCYTSILVICQE